MDEDKHEWIMEQMQWIRDFTFISCVVVMYMYAKNDELVEVKKGPVSKWEVCVLDTLIQPLYKRSLNFC